jgi:hypothetical protein
MWVQVFTRLILSSCEVQTELLDRYEETSIQDASAAHADDLGAARATFSWSKEAADDGGLTPSRPTFHLRIEDDLVFVKGCVNLIVGPTGCGKSSLLNALLGEMHYTPSGPSSWLNIPTKGGIAYCAQGNMQWKSTYYLLMQSFFACRTVDSG